MYYIKLQQVDYDDYPVGSARNIGPFDTRQEAEGFLEASDKFAKSYIGDYGYWRLAQSTYGARHTVSVEPVESLFVSPDNYK